MPILISQTFSRVTEESAQYGEADETGFNFENEPTSFRDLVELMREHPNASSYRNDGNCKIWLDSESEQDDFTDDYITTSIHFSRSNPERNKKYWRKAMLAAGLKVV